MACEWSTSREGDKKSRLPVGTCLRVRINYEDFIYFYQVVSTPTVK